MADLTLSNAFGDCVSSVLHFSFFRENADKERIIHLNDKDLHICVTFSGDLLQSVYF
jgi:hypothetical protein